MDDAGRREGEQLLAGGRAWVNGAPMADTTSLIVRGIWALIRMLFRIKALSGRVDVDITSDAVVLSKPPHIWRYERREISGIVQRAAPNWLEIQLRNGDLIELEFPNERVVREILTAWRGLKNDDPTAQ